MQNLLKLILKRSYYSVARRKFRDRKFKDRKFMEKFNNLKKRKNLVKFNPFYKKIILNQFLLWILIFVSFITPWKSVICCKIFSNVDLIENICEILIAKDEILQNSVLLTILFKSPTRLTSPSTENVKSKGKRDSDRDTDKS